jgi:hypothetical protein
MGKSNDSPEEALDDKGWEYKVDEGGGAFYGPKIDLRIKDALGQKWQCSTVQIDSIYFSKDDKYKMLESIWKEKLDVLTIYFDLYYRSISTCLNGLTLHMSIQIHRRNNLS